MKHGGSMVGRLLAIVALCFLVGCGRGPYDDLEDAFRGEATLRSSPIGSRTAILVSKRYRGAFEYRNAFTIRLSGETVEIHPRAFWMETITIPAKAVTACSAQSFGGDDWQAILLMEDQEVEILLPKAQEIVDWCWENRIPAATGAETRAWLYHGASLPKGDSGRAELGSREAYDDRIRQARLGY